MTTFAIALHAIAAVALIGPVMVATSMFPAQLAQGNVGALTILHRITNTYGLISALVPILGVAVFLSDLSTYGRQGQFHASILLAVIAWALLLFVVVPKQKAALTALGVESAESADAPSAPASLDKSRSQLAMFSGIFNLLWILCAVLMFI
ncbi:DUF2269 domain-containing protein [Corynebacterium lizhenjunii]|uniref:DUF2269 domain-containing protein n=1 Tax=Corynebacterium lizhenjunii TaxID=2709394 RepID=A0A7T0KH20_9CORY|nr:DUF2269 domain-containing protein [Corynebacterium lizhenjunii]QPK79960.1 DUF2269 domain-containing protein [Corynebacterium lizhenjunii]